MERLLLHAFFFFFFPTRYLGIHISTTRFVQTNLIQSVSNVAKKLIQRSQLPDYFLDEAIIWFKTYSGIIDLRTRYIYYIGTYVYVHYAQFDSTPFSLRTPPT